MFEKTIELLQRTIRAQQQLATDATGVMAKFTKDASKKMVDEFEQAIAVLNAFEEARKYGDSTVDLNWNKLKEHNISTSKLLRWHGR